MIPHLNTQWLYIFCSTNLSFPCPATFVSVICSVSCCRCIHIHHSFFSKMSTNTNITLSFGSRNLDDLLKKSGRPMSTFCDSKGGWECSSSPVHWIEFYNTMLSQYLVFIYYFIRLRLLAKTKGSYILSSPLAKSIGFPNIIMKKTKIDIPWLPVFRLDYCLVSSCIHALQGDGRCSNHFIT